MATKGVPLWSTTAASNATADPAVNWAEGMAPSAVNDSARSEMASVAQWRDDITGSTSGLSTGGTSTAYTVTTNSTFATAAAMSGMFLTIIPHTNCGAAPTLAVDGLTARAINISTGVAVPTAGLISGTPYLLKYVHASTEFILVGNVAALPNSFLATMAANTIKANSTGSTAVPTDATLGSGLSFSSNALSLSLVGTPQGRLTLTSATPVLITDTAAQSTVYYTPYIGNLIPIYNGTNFVLTTFAELSMVMSGANFAANAIYDLFVVNDSGTVRLGIGPVWSTLTAGSGARGSGAGTTELQLLQGMLTNKVTMTLRYGASSTVSVSANQATYVGSIFMDGTNSQVSCHVSYGQSRKWGIWNAYNRVPIAMLCGDGTASWVYGTATTREARGQTTNIISVFTGLPEEQFALSFYQNINGQGNAGLIGVGWNSTTAFLGYSASIAGVNNSSGNSTAMATTQVPAIGVNVVAALENASGGANVVFLGTAANMQLGASYRG